MHNAVDMLSVSPTVTGNKFLEHYELPVTLKLKLPKIDLPKFNVTSQSFFRSGRASRVVQT